MQLAMFDNYDRKAIIPPKGQLLKWIGNKQRFAPDIASFFPQRFGTYFEPFLGSGALLATLAPKRAIASDVFHPLVEIWQALVKSPKTLKDWYTSRWQGLAVSPKREVYERIKADYNACPNGPDLLFLTRACYGGVVRFRKRDGFMSTPCGIHDPIPPEAFARRVDEWHMRTSQTEVRLADYRETMAAAKSGDLVYCDPPYSFSQTILYGAQDFRLADLLDAVAECKRRGVFVAVSLDGRKKSGDLFCDIELPAGLFEREEEITCGRSMLRRFQMEGQTLEAEEVSDRLLLTY